MFKLIALALIGFGIFIGVTYHDEIEDLFGSDGIEMIQDKAEEGVEMIADKLEEISG